MSVKRLLSPEFNDVEERNFMKLSLSFQNQSHISLVHLPFIMNFERKLSLKLITLHKVVRILWNQNDIKFCISKLNSSDFSDTEWNKIEKRVIEKVPHLEVSQLLRETLLGFIKPIGLQIFKWLDFHLKNYNLPVHLPTEFCWTLKGTIDRQRTAEVLLKNGSLDVVTCYKLACIYCLEKDIDKYWNKMPGKLKEALVSHQVPLVIKFWSLFMKRNLSIAHIEYKDLFRESVRRCNKAAAQYFLQKLAPHEREETLIAVVKYIRDAEIMSFYLSVINEKQRTEIFKNNPYKVLHCFLQWPFQSYFIGIANCMWEFLSGENYEELLKDIFVKFINGDRDCNYKKLFTLFWEESSSELKSFVTNKIPDSRLFELLLYTKYKEFVKLILKDATLTAKEKFLYSHKMNTFCECSIRHNEWDFLEFCIQECCPSKNEIIKFKEEYESRMKHPNFKRLFSQNKQRWDKIFSIYDNSTKRSVEEVESSSSKRLHSLQ